MRKITTLVFFIASVAAGLSQSLPLNELGKPFSSPTVPVQWHVQTNVFPPRLSIYHIIPTKFSQAIISNLLSISGLAENDRVKGDNFASTDGTRTLHIVSATGTIEYSNTAVVHSGLTTASVGVPKEAELFGLTTNLLPKLGLSLSEIKRKENSTEREFNFYEPQLTMFRTNSMFVTNIPERSVFFRRALDNGAVLGNDEGGNCWIFFGSHYAISKIDLKWPAIEVYKSFPSADFKKIAEWIHQGKARHGLISSDVGEFDWSKLKSITVTKAEICYVTNGKYVYPLASLWTSLDTGYGNVDVEIDCPIIDTK